jgi:hypothetical protein
MPVNTAMKDLTMSSILIQPNIVRLVLIELPVGGHLCAGGQSAA